MTSTRERSSLIAPLLSTQHVVALQHVPRSHRSARLVLIARLTPHTICADHSPPPTRLPFGVGDNLYRAPLRAQFGDQLFSDTQLLTQPLHVLLGSRETRH